MFFVVFSLIGVFGLAYLLLLTYDAARCCTMLLSPAFVHTRPQHLPPPAAPHYAAPGEAGAALEGDYDECCGDGTGSADGTDGAPKMVSDERDVAANLLSQRSRLSEDEAKKVVDKLGVASCLAKVKNLGTADPNLLLKSEHFDADRVDIVMTREDATAADMADGKAVTVFVAGKCSINGDATSMGHGFADLLDETSILYNKQKKQNALKDLHLSTANAKVERKGGPLHVVPNVM